MEYNFEEISKKLSDAGLEEESIKKVIEYLQQIEDIEKEKLLKKELKERIKLDINKFAEQFEIYNEELPSYEQIINKEDEDFLAAYISTIIHHPDATKEELFSEQVNALIESKLKRWSAKFPAAKNDLNLAEKIKKELEDEEKIIKNKVKEEETKIKNAEAEQKIIKEEIDKLDRNIESHKKDYKGSTKNKIINIVMLMSVAFVLVFTTIAFMSTLGNRYHEDTKLIQTSSYIQADSNESSNENKSTSGSPSIPWVWIGYAMLFFAMGKIVAITYDYIEENTGEEPKWIYYSTIIGTFIIVGLLMYTITLFTKYDSAFKDKDNYYKSYLQPIDVCEKGDVTLEEVLMSPNDNPYCYAWFNAKMHPDKFKHMVEKSVEIYRSFDLENSDDSSQNDGNQDDYISPEKAQQILIYYKSFHKIITAKEKLDVTMTIIKLLFALAEFLVSSFAWLTFGRFLNSELYRKKLEMKKEKLQQELNNLTKKIDQSYLEIEILREAKANIDLLITKINKIIGNIGNHIYSEDRVKQYIERNITRINFLYQKALSDVVGKIFKEKQMEKKDS